MLPKVLVAMETCEDWRYVARRKLCEQTWTHRLPANFTYVPFTGPMLGVPDNYYGLSQKTRAICRYARERDFDWLVKLDDDVFVRAERLRIPHRAGLLGLPDGA